MTPDGRLVAFGVIAAVLWLLDVLLERRADK